LAVRFHEKIGGQNVTKEIGISPVPTRRFSLVVVGTVTAVWLVLLGIGFLMLWQYGMRPGEAATVPGVWPDQVTLPRSSQTNTLLMFVHPWCPCTRASVNELARLQPLVQDRVQMFVVVLDPEGGNFDWRQAAVVKRASTISGAQLICDQHGKIARSFGVTTSGAVVLYDSAGKLLFHGGLTGSRGYEGDSLGRAEILARLHGDRDVPHCPDVFGCPLFAREPPVTMTAVDRWGQGS
jgi:hypothetical protein